VAGGTLTIVFTDAVASTEARSALGDDRFDVVQAAHLDLLRAELAEHGGREVKSMGDGLLVVFDGAADALRAAVAMQQAIDLGLRRGEEGLRLTVGVALGDVDVADDGDVAGTPVVEAARLNAQAAPGQILATDLVRLVAGSRGDHAFIPVGPVDLKGLPEPVVVVEVGWAPVAVGEGPPPVPLPARLAADEAWPFVGRAPVVAEVDDWWREVTSGARRVVLLGGEPGVGKSRLAREVAVAAHEKGALVLFGRCEEDLGVAYQPFAEALGHHLAHLPADERATLLGSWSGVLRRLTPEAAGEDDEGNDPRQEQWMLFEALVDWLAVAAEQRPVVLFLDDVHWATKPTLLALLHLVRSDRTGRVLVLATYRDTELGRIHPLVDALADLRREPGVHRVAIRGLDGDGVAELVTRVGGQSLDAGGAAFAATVHEQTQGNPFFAGEVLRHLAETGAIAQGEDGRWSAAAEEGLDIPEGVREVVGRRVSKLSEAAGRLLGVAAVAGPSFEGMLVGEVAGLTSSEALDALEEAETAGLVADAGAPGRFTFAHALVRQTLEEELTSLRRLHLHRALALATEARWGDGAGPRSAELARHWREAAVLGDAERLRAAHHAERAARQAMDRFAYEEAAAVLEATVEVLDGSSDPEVGRAEDELLSLLFLCRLQGFELLACSDACRRRLARARRAGDHVAFGDAAAVLSWSLIGRQPTAADLVAFEEAVELDVSAAALSGRRMLNFFGEWEERDVAHHTFLVRASLAIGTVLGAPLGPAASAAVADPFYEEVLARAADATTARAAIEARVLECWLRLPRPDAARMLEVATELQEALERSRLRLLMGASELFGPAYSMARLGRLDELERHAVRVAEHAELTGDRLMSANSKIWRAAPMLARGEAAAALPVLDALMVTDPDEPSAQAAWVVGGVTARLTLGLLDEVPPLVSLLEEAWPAMATGLGAVHAAITEDDERCRAALGRWVEGGRHLPMDFGRTAMLWGFTLAAHRVGDAEAAVPLRDALLPLDGELLLCGTNTVPVSVAHLLGLLAEVLGDHDGARQHLEQALAFEERIGAVTLAEGTRAALATLAPLAGGGEP